MNDNEIIKALKCCIYGEDGISDCKNCPLKDKDCEKFLLSDVLAIINRQQAEIERLQNDNKYLQDRRWKELCEVKTEAIKEFAERLKKLSHNLYPFSDEPIIDCKDIDNLVKEMVGEESV